MSRAILKVALARTLNRQPTDAELFEFLQALRDQAVGQRVYIPQREPDSDQATRILRLRSEGLSIRKIAKSEGVSKSQVHRSLSQNPDLLVDSA